MKAESLTDEYPMMIREQHLDTFGHVNNAMYLVLLEEARWEMITRNGYGLREVHEAKIGPVVLDMQLKFSKELKNREKIIIKTRCYDYKGKVGKIEQIIVNQKGEEACTALFTFGLFDLKARRLIAPTPEWLKAIGLN